MYVMKGLDEWYTASPKTTEYTEVYNYYKDKVDEMNSSIPPSTIVIPVGVGFNLEGAKVKELTIKERNDVAFDKLKSAHQNLLKQDSGMSIGDVREFGEAVLSFKDVCQCPDKFGDKTNSQISGFLLSTVDTQMEDIGTKPRYKLINKYSWAMNNAIRDWNNLYEMGQ